jgi:hypothetical protein
MKIKNNDLMVATQFLGRINSEDHGIRFAFKTSTIINRVNEKIEIVEKLRKGIVEKHTAKNEAGEPILLGDKKQYVQLTPDGTQKLGELFELESDLDIEQYTMDELEANAIKIKPAEIPFLKWLIK